MQQVSAWGQFWYILYERHQVHRCGITTPLQGGRKDDWRKPYYATWFKQTPTGAIYRTVDGYTMIDMMRNGLAEFGVNNVPMKSLLLAVAVEDVTYALTRTR